jgi:hypothetical protein
MTTPDTDLSSLIAENAAEPASASVDGTSASSKPLESLIAADRHLAAKRGAAHSLFGIRVQPIVPGGPVGRSTR